MKNLAKYISIGMMATLTSCESCKPEFQGPKTEEVCTNQIKVNFKEATYQLYSLSGDPFRELKGAVTIDTTDSFTGTYTSTYPDLGTGGTYTKDCRFSTITFKSTAGEMTWKMSSHTTTNGKYYKLTDGCQVDVPQYGSLTGVSTYSLEIVK